MTTCNNCKSGSKVPNYTDKYYCSKLVYELKGKYNKPDFGCTRGIKK